MIDSIQLSKATAAGLSLVFDQDFNTFEPLERMAWIVLIMKKLEDREEWFPRGKWGTIQSIWEQLERASKEYVEMKKETK